MNMAFPEYQLRQFLNIGWIREKDRQTKWIIKNKKTVSTILSLEEEIYSLRRQLEQLVLLEKSLSSPGVVGISMILDKKINEYMERNRK
jgi:hypothetical protein